MINLRGGEETLCCEGLMFALLPKDAGSRGRTMPGRLTSARQGRTQLSEPPSQKQPWKAVHGSQVLQGMGACNTSCCLGTAFVAASCDAVQGGPTVHALTEEG